MGYTAESESSLKSFSGDPARYSCIRNGRKFSCVISFANGAKPISGTNQEYELVFEAGESFDMKLSSGGDYITVNRNTHKTIIVTRVVAESLLEPKYVRAYFSPEMRQRL